LKRSGILNPELLSLLTRMGHTDYVTICDRGFPVPQNQERIDLSLIDNIPTVLDVLRAVSHEFVIDRIIIAEEMEQISKYRLDAIRNQFPNLRIEKVSHLELKRLSLDGKGMIRTGDTCQYANLILVSG
jgi:D-ribose pyranase